MKNVILNHVLKVLGSQVFLGLIGVFTLPIAARGFGVENYGIFSLFVVLLGVIYVLDLSRILAVPKLSGIKEEMLEKVLGELTNFTFINALFVAAFAGIIGSVFIGLKEGIIMSSIGFIYTITGLLFSIMSVRELIGEANIVKNVNFAIAYGLSAVNAYLGGTVLTSMYFFLLANLLILFLYSHIIKKNIIISFESLVKSTFDFSKLKKNEFLDVSRLLVFNLSGGILTTTDKSILKDNASSSNFGIYAGQADLALKINMISNSIGTVLFPEFSKLVKKNNTAATRNLICNALLLGSFIYFLTTLVLIKYSTQFVTFVLGENFLSDINYFSFFLIGVFVNYTSFLTVPLQRAYGDYKLSKNFYLISAVLVICNGLWLIPIYGEAGALICYIIPRLVDIILLIVTFLKYFQINTKVTIALVLFFAELSILLREVLNC